MVLAGPCTGSACCGAVLGPCAASDKWIPSHLFSDVLKEGEKIKEEKKKKGGEGERKNTVQQPNEKHFILPSSWKQGR